MDTNQSPPPANGPESFIGSLFADRYRVTRVISEGAKTLIADAIDEQTGRNCTLKIVRARLSAQPSIRDRFDETMRGVAAMSHPNIVAVYDWGFAPIGSASVAYLVVEQLNGGSLRDMFDRGRRLTPSQGLTVGLEACRALDYAHRRGFVHGELTPAKIVFGDDRRLRIIDFGLSDLLSADAWDRLDSLPTHVAWYAAPEQGPGQTIDGKADVYALSLILHEAVTGTLPFKSDSTVATLAARQNKLMPVSADLGPLAAILERSGRPEPDERSSAADLGAGLVRAASKLPRPEPLPLLSTGLFEVPAEQLRAPHDPTGGVLRPEGMAEAAVRVIPLDLPQGADASSSDTEHIEIADTAAVQAEDKPDVQAEDKADIKAEVKADMVIDNAPVDAGPADAEAASDAATGATGRKAPRKSAARKAAARKMAARKKGAEATPSESATTQTSDTSTSDTSTEHSSAQLDTQAASAPAAQVDEFEPLVIDPSAPVPEAPIIIEAEPDLEIVQPVADDLLIVPVPEDSAKSETHAPGHGGRDITTPIPNPAAVTGSAASASSSTGTAGAVGTVSPVDDRDEQSEPPQRRRRTMRVLIGLLIAVALIGLAGVAYALFRNTSNPVPELVGVPEAQATAEIEPFGWVVTVQRERSDEVPEAGNIVRTVPAAGVDVPKGDPFLMVVSDGPVLRVLPNLIGMTSADAQSQLRDLNINADVTNDFDENVPVDSVISWTVEGKTGVVAGDSLEPGSTVHLVVSKGPAPRVVPNIVGQPADAASKTLGDLRLVPTEGGREFSDDVPAGVIISQTPAPDTSVARDSAVTFVVSNGPDLVTFPALEPNLTYNDVYQRLIDAGFQVKLVLGDAQGVVSSYQINGQPVEAGQTFKRGTQVDVTAL